MVIMVLFSSPVSNRCEPPYCHLSLCHRVTVCATIAEILRSYSGTIAEQ